MRLTFHSANDKNLCIFFLRLSNLIGNGRDAANFSRFTSLIDCRRLTKMVNLLSGLIAYCHFSKW